MSTNKIVLGLDPGLAHFGYCALALPPDPFSNVMRVDSLGVFVTKKLAKKRQVLATEDNLLRARELARSLGELFDTVTNDKNTLVALAVESMSWPRNASSTSKIGIAWGVLAALAYVRRLPIIQASPQAVKRHLTGRIDTTKEEVEVAACARVPRANLATGCSSTDLLLKQITKTNREHASDALAIAITCLDSDVVRAARL